MASAGGLVAAGLIIFRKIQSNIEYLLLQTSYGQHHWTPPKGHVDPGESELQTAIRETEEEAGLSEQAYNILSEFKYTLNYEVKGRPKRVVYWLAEMKNQECPIILSDEHQTYVWSTLDRALEISQYSDMQKLLKEADNHIKSQK
ncbi:bis(5'-nucleosyl)-tetraphosphatase [asymmetrical]-like [Mytilus edulis]|uniref:Bis(5'-nucleosyl)-tetraphosphatase [asymmetrical] n=1 Tax=Mytilus galloprovincialis TaxID=29158 RepID=A0A8B6EEG0_MYTGA|nr:bis(5'-nucleosidyl)-tetraphosphatase [Mytilus galloprovincialis]